MMYHHFGPMISIRNKLPPILTALGLLLPPILTALALGHETTRDLNEFAFSVPDL